MIINKIMIIQIFNRVNFSLNQLNSKFYSISSSSDTSQFIVFVKSYDNADTMQL